MRYQAQYFIDGPGVQESEWFDNLESAELFYEEIRQEFPACIVVEENGVETVIRTEAE